MTTATRDHVATNGAPIKLNLGGGERALPGFKTIDRKSGGEVYPLTDYADGSVDEIYASHVLEHFSHRQIGDVLAEWVRVLRVGGKLRLAVPDFRYIARGYLSKAPINTLGYVMGGHVDKDDCHGAIFDEESLTEMMVRAGLTAIGPWRHADMPEHPGDCSNLEVSLNLQGVKPCGGMGKHGLRDVIGLMSAPRFGPIMHYRCVVFAMQELGLRYSVGSGAYWHQVLTSMIEDAIEHGATKGPPCNWLLTFDYDTIFDSQTLLELYRCAHLRNDIDAITVLQMKRHDDAALFCVNDDQGKPRENISIGELTHHLMKIRSGHFGLTLLRVDAFRKLKKPWFTATPDPQGAWRDGKEDADVYFWRNWQESGNTLYMAPRVHVGHLQEMVVWPQYRQTTDGNYELKPHYQSCGDFEDQGPPRLVG